METSSPLAQHAWHALDSDFVRDQLVARSIELNGKRHNPDGEFVLYWMQSSQRLEENWALRAATRAADRFGRPLVVHQGLDPTYPHAADRHHAFILEGARETAVRARALGVHYQFVLRLKRSDDRRVLDRLARRAYLVFTDLFPTAGVKERSERFALRAPCRVLAVESSCVVPCGLLERAEYAARTIRPKLARLLDHALEPVADRPPRVSCSQALLDSLANTMGTSALDVAGMDDAAIAREVALSEIDHSVPPVRTARGGLEAATAQLSAFLLAGLAGYDERRNDANDAAGTSGLSPWLHFGQLASAQVVRAARAHASGSGRAGETSLGAFVQQVTTWRELSFNWCLRTPRFDALDSLPAWVQKTMAAHAKDPRPVLYDLDTLENGATHDALWNAAQWQLRTTGTMHNYARMLWGKTLLLWTPDYETARQWMFHLNDKWALDGRDPNSVGGIMWCLGLWDRPWGNKPVWGGIRPMVTARARSRFDVGAYAERWLPTA